MQTKSNGARAKALPGVTISAYMPFTEALLLRSRAEAHGRPISVEVREAIRSHLNDERQPEAGVVQGSGVESRHGEG